MNGLAILERPWARLGAIWLVWTLVGLFFTSQIYFSYVYTERPVPFSRTLFTQLTSCYLAALITPLILWLARRYPIERPHWRRSLLIHIGASTLLAIIFTTTDYAIYTLVFRVLDQISLFDGARTVVFNFDRELEIYWLIVLLSHAFNYHRRYREEELRASRLEALLAQAHLQALKMQIHPHFLFNTLNTISELVHRDREAADQTITHLSDLLRISLEQFGVREVPLKQELDFLKKYLEIEQMRFQGRLRVQIEVDPETLDARVPNMILQPLVENAIRYAVAPRSAGGRIEIYAHRQNGMLHLQVCDDGEGLPPEGSERAGRRREGVGLANTRARLEHLYSTTHRFDLRNSPDGGLVVSLTIPFVESATEADGDDPNPDR